jgi:hypothetical protein
VAVKLLITTLSAMTSHTYTLKLPGVQKMGDSQIAGLIETLRHGSTEARKQTIGSFSDEVLQKSD